MKCAVSTCQHAASATIQMDGETREICAGHRWIWNQKIEIVEDAGRCRICREPLTSTACRGLCKKDYMRASAAHALDMVALPLKPKGDNKKAAAGQIATPIASTTPAPARASSVNDETSPKDILVAEIDMTIADLDDEMSPAELVSALPWLDLTRIAASLRSHCLPDRVVVSQLSHLMATHYAPELPERTVDLIASLVLEVA